MKFQILSLLWAFITQLFWVCLKSLQANAVVSSNQKVLADTSTKNTWTLWPCRTSASTVIGQSGPGLVGSNLQHNHDDWVYVFSDNIEPKDLNFKEENNGIFRVTLELDKMKIKITFVKCFKPWGYLFSQKKYIKYSNTQTIDILTCHMKDKKPYHKNKIPDTQ